MWQDLLVQVRQCRDAKEVLLLIYKELDNRSAFRYAWTSLAAKESLDLLLQETA
jgi:hypothetical protein